MSTQPKPYLTPEQYLAIERAAQYKSEYFDGEMFAMSGGSLNHARIASNVSLLLGVQLRGHSCEVVGSDLRLQARPGGPYFYPDIVVFCGNPQLADSHRDMLTDATVIVEVLSPSTELYDRAFKFRQYQALPSLKDYILIAQDRVHVQHRTRQGDGSWTAIETSDRDAVIQLPSIECYFRVGDAYDRVDLTAEP